MRKNLFLLSIIALICASCSCNNSDTVRAEHGKTLPAWSEGHLDIHFINTGRGECCFYILPDGTTLLVDAGELAEDEKSVAQRPNSDTAPHITFAKYIKHFLPEGKSAIDYCSPSHLHTDHIGGEEMVIATAEAGYRKAGLTALYDYVPFNHILDHAYPTYTEDDVTPAIEGQLSEDWATFVTWGVKEGKFTAERFTPGCEQIVLVNNAKRYKDFSILNICANGFVLGKDKNGNTVVKGKKSGKGNPASCGFHISYGDFDYLACGDLTSSAQNLMAQYFRDFIGCGNLEAFKCNHHLAGNSWGSQMEKCNFNPRVVLNHCFASNKPHPEKLAYVLSVAEAFFATNIHPSIESNPDVKANKLLDRMTAYNGHIVLRVTPGGENFYVYMLDDSDFEYRTKFISGPYKSR